jgi:putative FmdB family regulatory protein
MPLYEYKCLECDHVVEKIRGFKEDLILIPCDGCDRITEHKKMISTPAFKVVGGTSEKMKVR